MGSVTTPALDGASLEKGTMRHVDPEDEDSDHKNSFPLLRHAPQFRQFPSGLFVSCEKFREERALVLIHSVGCAGGLVRHS